MRYFSKKDAVSAVNANRVIEQFLLPKEEAGFRALRWVSVEKDRDQKFSVSKFEVFDEGNLKNLDLYSFSFVDPDNPIEEVRGIAAASMAIDVAIEKFGADACKFVNRGIIQDEYADFLRTLKDS